MEFDYAATKLKKDHAELRSRAKRRPQTMATSKATIEAKKRQQYRQQQLEKKKIMKRREQEKLDYIRNGFRRVETSLGVLSNLNSASPDANVVTSNNNVNGALMLEATSIHGQGDKITLPSSLLSTLANRDLLQSNQERNQPLFFRLGIPRPGYVFPSSEAMMTLMNTFHDEDNSNNNNDNNNTHEMKEEDDSMMEDLEQEEEKEKEEERKWQRAYLDELSQQYISYAYASVIEFTQDEGYVGLPLSIATSLLEQGNDTGEESESQSQSIESKYTIDPASISSTLDTPSDDTTMKSMNDDVNHQEADIKQQQQQQQQLGDDLESKTPGHPAYNAFPIPVPQIHISLITKLPLGKKCTLQPSREAIQNGFYNLKNVKLALEQSLIRTRGCLNVGDIVHCWHRGKQFDLRVRDLSPDKVKCVSCVNTDVEVDIAAADDSNGDNDDNVKGNVKSDNVKNESSNEKGGRTISEGYRLSDDRVKDNTQDQTMQDTPIKGGNNDTTDINDKYQALIQKDLPNEPPIEQKENIITIQIRGGRGGKQCRRRFDSSVSKMEDIFSFVISECLLGNNEYNDGSTFRLVTRFPRRVFTLEEDGSTLLDKMGLSSQELFLMEKI